MDINIAYTYSLLRFLLPLIGYTKEPITTLSLTYRNPIGHRIIITMTNIYWNY